MANKIREMIEKIEEDEDRTEGSERLIALLKARECELGEDISDEIAAEAIKECFSAYLAEKVTHCSDKSELSEEEIAHKNRVFAVVKEYFDEERMWYSADSLQKGIECIEMGVRFVGGNLKIKIFVEARPKVCRIDVIYPVNADPEFDYVLCRKIADENYPRRFGALQYDARDGEVSYRYSFPTHQAFSKADFEEVFKLVMSAARGSYKAVRRCCVGLFKPSERHSIIEKAEKMIETIKEYEG